MVKPYEPSIWWTDTKRERLQNLSGIVLEPLLQAIIEPLRQGRKLVVASHVPISRFHFFAITTASTTEGSESNDI